MARIVLNMLVVVLIAAIVTGGVWYVRGEREKEEAIVRTKEAVQAIQRMITVQAGTLATEVNGRGWPKTVDPSWFDGQTPKNLLVSRDRPWLEVAPPNHADYKHPVVRMTIDDSVASFWYNPGNGIVRARTSVTVSDRLATELYNYVNESSLKSIFEDTTPANSIHTINENSAVVTGEEKESGKE